MRKLGQRDVEPRIIQLVSGRTGIQPRLPGSEVYALNHYVVWPLGITQETSHSFLHPCFWISKGVIFYSIVDILANIL